VSSGKVHSLADLKLLKPEDQERVKRIGTGYRWIDVDGKPANFLSDDELENLNIRAGTLTQKERETINYHIVATIKMLEQLPWPKHLTRVPEYAGGHHERMDGKGYPKGLTRDQMSWQARMMGIADIFEALTAKDRPYKPGMKLSQAAMRLKMAPSAISLCTPVRACSAEPRTIGASSPGNLYLFSSSRISSSIR